LMSTSAGWTLGMRALLQNGCSAAIAAVQGASLAGLGRTPRFRNYLETISSELEQRLELAP
jgi:hypothetical protein